MQPVAMATRWGIGRQLKCGFASPPQPPVPGWEELGGGHYNIKGLKALKDALYIISVINWKFFVWKNFAAASLIHNIHE